MTKALLCVTAAVALAPVITPRTPAAQTRRPVSIDDLMTLRAIVDARISPDGTRVAYVTSTPSLVRNEHEAALFVVPSNGGAPVRAGEGVRIFNIPTPAPRLRWSPDGTSIGVLALVNGRPQVVAISPSGPASSNGARNLTSAPEGVFAYEWSPDGRTLAYLTRDAMPEEEARRRQDRSFIVRADAPDRPLRLFVQDASGSARVVSPPHHYVDAFSWAPDGREITYSAAPKSGFTSPYYTRIYAVAPDGTGARTIVDRAGTNSGPKFSPDGRRIAFISTNGRVDIMAPRSLAIVASHGGAPHLIPMDDAWVNEYVWSPDSASIYVQANDGTFGRREHMFEQALVRVTVADGRAERVDSGPSVAYSISVSKDGSRIAYRRVESRTMGDIVVMDAASGKAATITDVNPELRGLALGELKAVSWRSFDGMEIWGLLLTPPAAATNPPRRNGEAASAGPMLVYVHGGPGGGVTHGLFPQFMTAVGQVDPYPTEAMASEGYAVLFPMPRGGAGYGERGQRMIVDAWGEGDYKDIMAGVDAMVERGIADPDRLGVMGASYGGFMTNWIVTQTSRFKAASAGASLSDLTDVVLSEGGEFIVEYFKWPWQNRNSYVAHSPITFAEKVTTPLLLQHGEADPRVPVSGAWKFYRTLKTMGKTVELDVYPRGGHVLREPMQQREQMRRNLEWFRKWIPARVPEAR
jgi:dipeptidyl aminopeptidase/acylaminoacyl peptidase